MSDLFISYSRRDLAFVSALASALEDRQREVWVDLTAIPATAEWLNEIYRGIEEADAFLFVLSPDSVSSDMCRQELVHAVAARKRLVPLLFRAVADHEVAESLQAVQWLFHKQGETAAQLVERLIEVLDADLEWSAQHTMLLKRARDWTRHERDSSLLLRGNELRRAQEWAAAGRPDKQMVPAPEQLELISASEESARKRKRLADERRLELEQQRLAAVAAGQRAYSQRLAAQARAEEHQDPQLAALLAIEAASVSPTEQAEDALRHALMEWRLRDVWLGHRGGVRSIAFGRTCLVTSGRTDHVARVRNLETEQITELRGHGGAISSVWLNSDASLAVTAGDDHTVRLWRTDSGELVDPIVDVGAPASSAALTGDGSWLVATSGGGKVCLFELSSGRLAACVQGCTPDADDRTGRVSLFTNWRAASFTLASAAFDSSAGLLLVAYTDRTLELFDITKEERLLTLPARETVGLFEYGGTVRVSAIDELKNPRQPLPVRRPRLTGHTDSVEAVAFSPNGLFIVSASQDRTAILWDVRTGERFVELAHMDQVFAAVFSHDARWVATGDWRGYVRVWETRVGSPAAVLFDRDTAAVRHASFSSKPDEILTASESAARVWRLPAHGPVQVLRSHAGKIVSALFAGQDRVVTASDDGIARVWDVVGGECRAELVGNHGALTSLAVSGTGRLALTGAASGVAVLWDLEAGQAIRTFEGHSKQIVSAALSPDERFAATTSVDRTACVWDIQVGGVARTYTQHAFYPLTIEFSGDGGCLLTGGVDGTARIWTVDGERDTVLRHGSGGIRARFNRDASRVATAGEDGVLRLWDAVSGQHLRELRLHEGVIYTLAFSNDGRWLVTGGADCTARVWDVSTGEQICSFRNHIGTVLASAFSPDGMRLLIGTEFGEVYVYACSLCDRLDGLVAFARGLVRRELTQTERDRYLRPQLG